MTGSRTGRRKAMILDAFDRVLVRGREIVGEAERVRCQHLLLTAALADLLRDDRLLTILAEEGLDTLPVPICQRLNAVGRGE